MGDRGDRLGDMASSVTPPRGMRDFLPESKRARDRVLTTIAGRYQAHGFEPIETPVMEDHDTLHAGLGGDNEKLAFGVLKRGLSLEDVHRVAELEELVDLGLRFDLTVPLARYVASNRAQLPEVFRALHIGPVWRAERPQRGRFRQFVQCDIDILGQSDSLAEREVLLATADALSTLGLKDYRFRVNDRRLLQGVLAAAEVPETAHLSVLITLDKLDKIGPEKVLDELRTQHSGAIQLEVIASLLESVGSGALEWDAPQIASLMRVSEDIAQSVCSWAGELDRRVEGGRVVFDPTLVRGMGYYTGSIVELEHPGLGISLGGGGRYDGMVGRFMGTDMPAFGFSLGFERLMEVLPLEGKEESDRVAVIYPAGIDPVALVDLKLQLVSLGLYVSLFPLKKNLGAQLTALAEAKFTRVAQLGAEVPSSDSLSWRELGEPRS